MPPASVGRYEIIERIAIGGMAELFKARVRGDHGFEKLVVVKKILPQLAADPSFATMFFDEARITAQLEHPGIVSVYELGTDADTPYIAMQYIDGLDVLGLLRECARTGTQLSAHIAAHIAHQILDALDYAHTAHDASGRPLGIVHRDISPGNVLVSRRGDVKLTDFGIAWATERQHHTEAGTLKGKYGYMSPEQVLGTELDARSDLFSVGVLLAEMLIGHRLFVAPSDLEVLLMVRDARTERFATYATELEDELRSITERALQRSPGDRWPNAIAFRDALAGWLDGHGRVSARDLASLIVRLESLPTVDGAVVETSSDDVGTLSGPNTQFLAARAAEEIRIARAEYIAGRRGGGEVGDDPPVSAEDSGPNEAGDLRLESPIRLLYRLARQRQTGLLFLEGRAGILKEAYLEDGHPQYVSSNLDRERLGEYLVREGAISPESLSRALAVLPRFGGNLSETLVGLGLLGPLEAFRMLARQVGAKLIEACGWPKGRYRWYQGRTAPHPFRPLHLDGFRIVGAGAAELDPAQVTAWAELHRDRVLIAEPTTSAVLLQLGLGAAPGKVHAMLDGKTRLGDLAARVRAGDARTNLLRLAYLLVETDLATG